MRGYPSDVSRAHVDSSLDESLDESRFTVGGACGHVAGDREIFRPPTVCRGGDAALAFAAGGRAAIYHTMDKNTLIDILVARDMQIEKLLAEKKRIRRMETHYNRRCKSLVEDRKQGAQRYSELVDRICYRRGSGKVSVRGGYALAIRRNFGHASAISSVKMLAGDSDHGSLKSKDIVLRYEHKANCVQILKSKHWHEAAAAALAGWTPTPHMQYCIECFMYKGDASKNDALEHSKAHIAYIESFCLAHAPTEGQLQGSGPACSVTSQSVSCDIVPLNGGSGIETYMAIESQFRSAFVPFWTESVATANANPYKLSIYTLGVDQGSDNVNANKRIKRSLESSDSVMFCSVYCFHHQCHLAVRESLEVLDASEWAHERLPCRYFSGLATVCNVWRSTGNHKLIRNTAAELHGDSVAHAHFRSMLPRAIRGRWGSADACEEPLLAAREYVGSVFDKCFANSAKATKANAGGTLPKKQKIGAAEDALYSEQQKNYRLNATCMVNSDVFLAMLAMSRVAKQPFSHTLNWAQKASKLYAKHVGTAKANGSTYLGPTPLSEFVCRKSKEISLSFEYLFEEESLNDPVAWGTAWSLLPKVCARAWPTL